MIIISNYNNNWHDQNYTNNAVILENPSNFNLNVVCHFKTI